MAGGIPVFQYVKVRTFLLGSLKKENVD